MSKRTPGPWTAYCRDIRYRREDGPWPRDMFLQWDIDELEEPYGRGRFYEDDAYLVAAAPDLLAAQTMGEPWNTPDLLDWVAARLVHVHGEPADADFVLALRDRAAAGRAAVAKAEGRS